MTNIKEILNEVLKTLGDENVKMLFLLKISVVQINYRHKYLIN